MRPPVLRVICFLVLSVPAGFFTATVWIFAAMSVAGGGNAHNDLTLLALWGIGGAVVVPLLTYVAVALRDDRAETEVERRPRGMRRILLFVAAVAAAFAATSLWYYADNIADLRPDQGGPVSDIPGAVRRTRAVWAATTALVASLTLALVAIIQGRPRSKGS
jgi:hypothetical protein